jgi:hypothetical protein
MFCRNCFTTPLQNTPLGRSKKFRRDWNWMVHLTLWPVLMMLIYSVEKEVYAIKKDIETLIRR